VLLNLLIVIDARLRLHGSYRRYGIHRLLHSMRRVMPMKSQPVSHSMNCCGSALPVD
jgi:hypothetical protein